MLKIIKLLSNAFYVFIAWSRLLYASIKRRIRSNSDGTEAEEVNCWFCNKNWNVEAKNRNSWWCPGCEQYNGFTVDGDYNQDLSAHFNLMEGKPKAVTSPPDWDSAKSVLCSSCGRNQVIKVRQLATFVPFCEADYEDEVSKYKSYLESVYELCSSCQGRVDNYIKDQDASLMKKMEKAQVKLKPVDRSADNNGRSRMQAAYSSERSPSWLKPFFFLCVLLASFQMFLGLMSVSSNKLHILTRVQKVLEPYLPKLVLDKGQWSAFAGACLCAVGLYCCGKYSIYPEDAIHLLSWLLLVLAHSEVLAAHFPGFQGNAPLMIAISTVSVIAAAACYFRQRYPRHFCAVSLNKKSVQSMNRTSHCDTAVKRADSKAHKKKTKTCDGGMPVVSLSHSPVSFSPSMQATVDQPVLEDVTQDLETFSLGLRRKSGSSSSIWSLPAIASRPASPADATSSAPDSSSSSLNIAWPGRGHDPRSILSPSRLGFLTFSSAAPSPGSSRSVSPATPWSSPNEPAFFSPINPCPSPTLSSTHSSTMRPGHKGPTRPLVQSSSSFRPTNCLSNFTSSAQEAESTLGPCDSQTQEVPEQDFTFRSKRSFTDYQLRQDANWREDSFEKFCSISENHKNDKNAPRRSARLASSKTIHRPWPLKRSLSCNNMFDRFNSDSAGAKSRTDIMSNNSAFRRTPTIGNSSAPVLHENMPTEHCYKTSGVGMTERCVSSKDHKRFSKPTGGRKKFYPWRDELSDVEEDELDNRAVYNKEKWARRSEYVKDTSWTWVCVGILIGVSVTTNLFLLLQPR